MTYLNYIALAGGIGMFLYGIKIMGEGLELAAGNKLKKLLEKITSNRIIAVLVGLAVTALIQSSAATTVMVVGFVNAGLMNLLQAVGIIMGANIGTTMTSVLIALDLSSIAPVFLFIGVVMMTFSKKKMVKHIGQIIAGFGLLFLGIKTMSGAMEPLRDNQTFRNLIATGSNPLVGVLIGFVVTAVMQSSSASIGVLQAMAVQGLVPIGFASYVLYGQNIGSCVTTMLSAAGTKTNSKRAAVIHLLFNCIGTAIFILITMFTPFTKWIEMLTDNTVVQISLVHIIFNVVCTCIMLPAAKLLVKAACFLVPEKANEQGSFSLEYLDERILTTSPLAVAQAGKETMRMAMLARNNFSLASRALLDSDKTNIEDIMETEELINFLNHNITRYLVKINALDISREDAKYIGRLFNVVNDIERIGDHAQNLVEAASAAIEEGQKVSPQAKKELEEMQRTVLRLLDGSIEAFEKQNLDVETAKRLNALEEEVDNLKDAYQMAHIERLNNGECETHAGMLFVNTIIDFERIGDHATNIEWAVKVKPTKEQMESVE